MTTPPPPFEELSVEEVLEKVSSALDASEPRRAFDLCTRVLEPLAPLLHAYGVAQVRDGRADAGLPFLSAASQLAPTDEKYLLLLARALVTSGKAVAASAAIDKLLALNDASSEAHELLGVVQLSRGDDEEAIASLRRAVAIRADAPVAWAALGKALLGRGLLHDGISAIKRSLEILPKNPDAWDSLVSGLQQIGEHATAAEASRRAPPGGNPIATLLLANADPYGSAVCLAEKHRACARELTRGVTVAEHVDRRDISSGKRIRIGYVSGDFRDHSVAFFIAPILTHHDRTQFETYCYYTAKSGDRLTATFASAADNWREVSGKTDEELAAIIREDCIDIVVDLSGYTDGGRVRALARRPAPINIGYIGYPNTRGLKAFDYFITDDSADPPGMTEHLFDERLLRLPTPFLCYRPPAGAPTPVRVADKERGIVFGSFNAHWKLNPPLLETWARILRRCDDSRLVLKARGFADPRFVSEVVGILGEFGVESSRIEAGPWTARRSDHLAMYDAIDIALDTSPYNGTTTTCEALWQGVPLVTMAGDRHAARVGVSILSSVGLAELIATDAEDYVERALALASDRARLDALHRDLRDRMLASPLTREREFVTRFESALHSAWNAYCDKSAKSSSPWSPGSGVASSLFESQTLP